MSQKTSRRDVVRMIAAAGMLPAVPFAGCGDDSNRSSAIADAGNDAGPSTPWASGGTAAMTDQATYPNPFGEVLDSCKLVATTTAGPCTTEDKKVRQDISEDWRGIPMRLALKVVDATCSPVAGANVEVWHTNIEGSYSGETPSNGFCLLDQSYASSDFFRGTQTSDDEGVVVFDSCFPGWYPGRAIHIHFQVSDEMTTYRVSQLFFPEDVTQDIFAHHVEYRPFGQPDTVFATDGVMAGIAAGERSRHIANVELMSDGAMLASKVVAVA